jgi:hypothetical protein
MFLKDVTIYQNTMRHIPHYSSPNTHRRDNLLFRTSFLRKSRYVTSYQVTICVMKLGIYIIPLAKQVGSNGNGSYFYFGGAWFEFQSEHRLS